MNATALQPRCNRAKVPPRMKKSRVLRLFGGAPNCALLLKISHQAVYKWPEKLPVSAQRKVRKVIREFLEESDPPR